MTGTQARRPARGGRALLPFLRRPDPGRPFGIYRDGDPAIYAPGVYRRTLPPWTAAGSKKRAGGAP